MKSAGRLLLVLVVAVALLQFSVGGSQLVRSSIGIDGGKSVDFTCSYNSIGPGSATAETAAELRRNDWRLEPNGRAVYAIGDLHGDWDKAVASLQLAGALGPNASAAVPGSLDWAGGDRIVVQVGDVLDRGSSELGISNLLGCLDQQARASGGRLVRILGNHELMNAMGHLSYATHSGTRQFGGDRARREAFAPGGSEALRLAELNVVQMVGDTLFVHAGLLPAHASHAAIEAINSGAQEWLRSGGGEPAAALTSGSGPLWTREYWGYDRERACAQLEEALAASGAQRMVVGHTITPRGEIRSECEGRLWGTDVGMSRGMRNAAPAVLRVDAGAAAVPTNVWTPPHIRPVTQPVPVYTLYEGETTEDL